MDIHFKIATELDPVAITALIFSLISGFFSVYVWWRSHVHARFTVQLNIIFVGGGSSQADEKELYVCFRVANIGDKPFTLKGIYGRHWQSRLERLMGKQPKRMYFPVRDAYNNQNIPAKIDVGEEWIGFVYQTAEIEAMLKQYMLFEAAYTLSKKTLKTRSKLYPAKTEIEKKA
jgi:hypothetical protein